MANFRRFRTPVGGKLGENDECELASFRAFRFYGSSGGIGIDSGLLPP